MTKKELITKLIKEGVLRTKLIIEAFYEIDRINFVPEEYKKEAYEDYPLPIGFGQTISQPFTVAFMLELLNPRPGEKILEIGSGSGWVTALLAYCVSNKKNKISHHPQVIAIERIKELKELAEKNVSRYNFIEKGIVQIILGDGSRGSPQNAPYDKIISAASAEFIPVSWKKEVKVGGRIVTPIKNAIDVYDKLKEDDFNIKSYSGFSFVPLVIEDGSGI